MIRVLLLIIGYVCGLFQTGYIYGRMNGIDIRSKGSGNAGATNTLRVLGKKAGIIVFLGDALKSLIPCLIVRMMFKDSAQDAVIVYMLYLAIGVILGHNYPFYLEFKGGKGISSMAGLSAALDIRLAIICLLCFAAIVAVTKYVSVGSLVVAVIILVFGSLFGKMGWIPVGEAFMTEYVILLLLIAVQAFIRHRANIGRLMNGTENRLGAKKTE